MKINIILIALAVIIPFGSIAGEKREKKKKKKNKNEVAKVDTVIMVDTVYVDVISPEFSPIKPSVNLDVEADEIADVFDRHLDSLKHLWYVDNYFGADSNLDPQIALDRELNTINSFSKTSDSLYIQRLTALNSAVDLSYNDIVKKYIELYAERRRGQVAMMLGLAQHYFPMFEETLDRYDMPIELKYMAIIESALVPVARSRMGASGLWQFMYTTGKEYGLQVDSYIDERRDPVKATDAAARYMKFLYSIYGDWHLAIAAYNCGPGNVNKAIRRSGGKRDYWDIYYRLPRETRGYVPAFIGATYAMSYAEELGIKPLKPTMSIVTDTIQIDHYLNLKQVAEGLSLPLEQIQALNPQYRADIIPATKTKRYTLNLPSSEVGYFIDNQDTIAAIDKEKYFPNNSLKKPSSSTYAVTSVAGKDKVIYKVKSGDNVGFIADWFNIRTSDLRSWNNIIRNKIKIGQKLSIFVPAGTGDHYNSYNSMSFSQKQARKDSKPTVTATKSSTVTKSSNGYDLYTIRSGDTLWSISKKFNGVTMNDLMKLNGLSKRSKLKIGQKIKVRKA